ncbi:MAG: addiction module toxin RelE [Candidatus Diapherotrites archaeon]|nr:addiction module toxin RelE [Candidatus Diapherotrites archaeon]
MPFRYDFSDELEETLKRLFKKDRQTYEAAMKKIEEIASRDENTIDFYKNLRYGLKEYKRVHIAKNLVLLFKVFKKEKFILFDRLEHHDNAYKR